MRTLRSHVLTRRWPRKHANLRQISRLSRQTFKTPSALPTHLCRPSFQSATSLVPQTNMRKRHHLAGHRRPRILQSGSAAQSEPSVLISWLYRAAALEPMAWANPVLPPKHSCPPSRRVGQHIPLHCHVIRGAQSRLERLRDVVEAAVLAHEPLEDSIEVAIFIEYQQRLASAHVIAVPLRSRPAAVARVRAGCDSLAWH